MKATPSLIGWRDRGDTERIEGAVGAIERTLGPLADEHRELAETIVLGFILAEKETSTMPVGLTTSRGQLEKLDKAAQALTKALEAVVGNPSLVGSLYRHGYEPGVQESVEALSLIARKIQRDLPARKEWPKKYVPSRELITALATLFERLTGRKAVEGIKHDRKSERYHGLFFDLVEQVLYELDAPGVGGRTITDTLG